MAVNGTKSSKSSKNSIRRDSYEDRFCEYLSQHILQYLGGRLETILRLECVSKQFYRALAKIPIDLVIVIEEGEDFLERNKALLKRFPNIKSIKIRFNDIKHFSYSAVNSVFDLIIKSCTHLNELPIVDCHILDISWDTLIKFFEKFGQNLSVLNLMEETKDVTNSSEIYYNLLSDINIIDLKRLALIQSTLQDLNLLKHFVVKNSNTLRHLSLNFNSTIQSYQFYHLMQFKNLVQLDLLGSKYCLNDEFLAIVLTEISMNCKQIKSLSLDVKTDTLTAETLIPLKSFPLLKRLKLNMFITFYSKIDINMFSFAIFRYWFKELTHLSIYFDSKTHPKELFRPLSEKVLLNIEKYLPKLQYLIFIGIQLRATEWTAHILGRLTDLKVVSLELKYPIIGVIIEDELKEKCKRITKIQFI